MQVKLKKAGSTLIVQMVGELDHHAVDAMRKKIDLKLNHEDFRNILFDFYGVNFMDSSGLGMILGRYKIVSEKGGKVSACSLNSRVMRVFEMAGLQTKIPVYSSEQDALTGA
ncbi:MAG TPA: anti-sigma F factor antagonist [Oscillospiraceae bacterium]|nr:anti-sigma F factor antagonist [Oscillospiraceae bacterium]